MAELSKAIARLMEQRERERTRPDNGGSESPEVVNARAQVAPGERSLAENFVRHFIESFASQEIDEGELRLLAMVGFRFVMERAADEPRIRVFDPNVAQDGWESSGTAVQILLRDRPFIIETVEQCLADHGSPPRRLLHLTYRIERDQRRAVLSVGPPAGIGPNEVFIHAEVERLPDPEAVAESLRRRLIEAMAAVDDYQSMRLALEGIVDELKSKTLPRPWNIEADEAQAFLEWLGAGNFVFLGYREYQLTGQGAQRTAAARPGSGLGVLRDIEKSSFATPQRLADPLRRRMNEPPLVMITKTNAEIAVHRKARMDYVGIKDVDASGVVVAERRFLGLFTQRMYAADSGSIPLLRRKLETVSEGDADIRSIFNTIPKVELFALSPADLAEEIAEIRAARGTGTLRVTSRPDAIGRGVFVLVIMPRDRYSADVRERIEERLVRVLQAERILEREVVSSDSGDARLHFYLAAAPENLRLLGEEDLLSEVTDLLRTWSDRLGSELENRFGARGRDLAAKYIPSLPRSYRDSTDIEQAVEDLRCLDELRKDQGAHIELVDFGGGADRRSRLRIYQVGEALDLGELVEGLVHFGMRVHSVDKQELSLADLGAVSIYSFAVEAAAGGAFDVESVTPLLPPALLRLRAGHLISDALNSLIVQARLSWDQVEVMRAYVNYCAEADLTPSREALTGALIDTPAAAHQLWRYFEAKFDPTDGIAARDREERVLPAVEREFRAAIDPRRNPVEASLLGKMFGAIAATVRTNFYVTSAVAAAKPARRALCLKFEGAKLVSPHGRRAAYEFYVEASGVRGFLLCDGINARAAVQAYGDGDGMRSELARRLAGETLHNFVSTPDAAVGGWALVRRGTATPTAAQTEGALRSYLGALLDVTDNVERGRIVPAARVVAYDQLSPFITLVAQGRGLDVTKVANQLAEERGFWLGDAFAAGQAYALDDYKMGTAARGAWECAQWHLLEAGEERDARILSVAGVGDMSDPAFGNGLLLSRRFRLRAAIGEQHILLDPDPDVSKSFAERERLFNLPRSTWGDYDKQLLSEGGGVYPRSAMTIVLSDPVRRMLAFPITQEVATPAEIVRAILCMETDLLWLGGSGLILRSNSDAPSRGEVTSSARGVVAAMDAKAKVIAEPRPDAITQRARIEYAQRGGRINTSAIDRAAAIDLADHEVNFKLVIVSAVEGGTMTAVERVQLLDEVKPQVGAAVLARSLAHARAISLDQRRSQTQIDDFRHLAGLLVAEGLAAAGDLVPNWDIAAGRRGPLGGLSRPELADLLALSKRSLQRRISNSDIPDDGFFETFLRDYFPESLNERCGQQIRSHKLRREIIAAEVSRLLVESMGVTFVSRLARETGADAAGVIRAWAVVVEISRALALWDEVGNAEPPLPLRADLACWEALAQAIESATRWVLQTQPPEATAGGVFEMYAEPTQELFKALPRLLPAGQLARINERVGALAREGVPRALPERIVPLAGMADVLDIVEIAAEYNLDLEAVTALFYEIGDLLDLDWVRDRIADLPADSRWERRARNSLNEGLLYVRKELSRRILMSRSDEEAPTSAVLEEYLVAHQEQLTRLGELIDDITSAQRPSLAALMVIVREYGDLVERIA